MTLSVEVQSYGDNAMAEEDLCRAVGEDLAKHYPGYDWCVGAILEAGTVAIDLMCEKPPQYRLHGYLLHISSLLAPGGHQRVMQAGGELLERYGLPRDRPPSDWKLRPLEGVDASGQVLKSRF